MLSKIRSLTANSRSVYEILADPIGVNVSLPSLVFHEVFMLGCVPVNISWSAPVSYPEEIWIKNASIPVSSGSEIVKFGAILTWFKGQYATLLLAVISGGWLINKATVKKPWEKQVILFWLTILK